MNDQTHPLNNTLPPQNALRDVAKTALERADGDLGRLMANGSRLLEQRRKRLREINKAYMTGRAALIAEQQDRHAELVTRMDEERRAFDERHEHQVQDLSREIARLEMMREAGEWPSSI